MFAKLSSVFITSIISAKYIIAPNESVLPKIRFYQLPSVRPQTRFRPLIHAVKIRPRVLGRSGGSVGT